MSIREEIKAARSIDDVIQSHPMYMTIAVHYVRPKQVSYVREALQAVIREVIDQEDLDLETDPVVVSLVDLMLHIDFKLFQIYRSRINIEEMRSGRISNKPKDLTYHDAVDDPDTRGEFIRRKKRNEVPCYWTPIYCFLCFARSSAVASAYQSLCQCHSHFDKEDALWYALHCSRDASRTPGMY